ncbi:hypothetical protein HOD88_01140 [archaeon]|jgi:hypothetical protein|nr:hypothetical protein [archaeon]
MVSRKFIWASIISLLVVYLIIVPIITSSFRGDFSDDVNAATGLIAPLVLLFLMLFIGFQAYEKTKNKDRTRKMLFIIGSVFLLLLFASIILLAIGLFFSIYSLSNIFFPVLFFGVYLGANFIPFAIIGIFSQTSLFFSSLFSWEILIAFFPVLIYAFLSFSMMFCFRASKEKKENSRFSKLIYYVSIFLSILFLLLIVFFFIQMNGKLPFGN